MVKKVRSIAFSGALTIGVVLGAIYLSKRFNVGGTLVEGFRGLGETTGEAISKPFAGIVGGVASGVADLQDQVARLFGQQSKDAGDTSINTGSQEAQSVIDLGQSVLATLNLSKENIDKATVGTSSYQDFLNRISFASNPEPSSPSTGFFYVTFSNGERRGPLALSESAINVYRSIGASVQRA